MAKLQSMESTRWRSWWKKHAFTTSYTLICYFLIKFKQYSFLKVNNILLIIKRTIFKSPSIWFTRFLSCISIFGWVSNHSHFQYIYIDQLNSFSNCDLIAQKKSKFSIIQIKEILGSKEQDSIVWHVLEPRTNYIIVNFSKNKK